MDPARRRRNRVRFWAYVAAVASLLAVLVESVQERDVSGIVLDLAAFGSLVVLALTDYEL